MIASRGQHQETLAFPLTQKRVQLTIAEQRQMNAYVKGGDSAGGVTGDKLDLHVDTAEEVFILGLESRPGNLVQSES